MEEYFESKLRTPIDLFAIGSDVTSIGNYEGHTQLDAGVQVTGLHCPVHMHENH